MPFDVARQRAQGAAAKAEELGPMCRTVYARLTEIQGILQGLIGSGYAATRIQSAALLAAECVKFQEQNNARIVSLIRGLQEL